MDCKITCSNSNSRTGMTLVEVMVAMAISSLVFLALGSLSIYSATSFRSMLDYSDINGNSRKSLDLISREIRQSRGLKSFNTNSNPKTLVFYGSTIGKTITLAYNQSDKTLVFQGESATNILKDCAYFNWTFFTHTTYSNFGFETNTDGSLCKMVQLDWECSRDDWRKATNSQSIQSMKVVIRKKPD